MKRERLKGNQRGGVRLAGKHSVGIGSRLGGHGKDRIHRARLELSPENLDRLEALMDELRRNEAELIAEAKDVEKLLTDTFPEDEDDFMEDFMEDSMDDWLEDGLNDSDGRESLEEDMPPDILAEQGWPMAVKQTRKN